MCVVINFIAFQAGWFASVIGAAQQMPWLGPLVLLGVIAIHLSQATRPDKEIGLIISCGLIGACFDSVLVASGWVTYASGYISTSLAPYWIVTMWMLFATTLNSSMGWLKGKLALAAIMGGIAGPLSYLAGERLGGMSFVEPAYAITFLAIGWAAVMPVLMTLADRLDGFKPAAEPAGEFQ